MARKTRLSPSSREAARLLGLQVRSGRRERGWTLGELAERVGTSEVTLRKVERGDPSVALGTAFEAASLVGVALFGADADRRQLQAERLLLLAQAPRPRPPIDDDF